MSTDVARLLSELVEQMAAVHKGLAELSDVASTYKQQKRLRAIAKSARSLLDQIRAIEPSADVKSSRRSRSTEPPNAVAHGDSSPRPRVPGWGADVQSWLIDYVRPYEIERLRASPEAASLVLRVSDAMKTQADFEAPIAVEEGQRDVTVDAYVDTESLEQAGRVFDALDALVKAFDVGDSETIDLVVQPGIVI